MSDSQKSIAVLMSGGVDSSVAAALLVEAGHKVVGFTLRLWDGDERGSSERGCCTITMSRDASAVCKKLGVQHYTLDFREEFQREVIKRFEEDYLEGRTPNPCVQCNSKVKWGKVLRRVQELGLDWIATGHYANVEPTINGEVRLTRGLDPAKDQSYFLWEIPAAMLARTIFPLGKLEKPAVRDIARRFDLPVAEKIESQDICFVGKDNYRDWLQKRRPELSSGNLAGDFVGLNGKVLGQHSGYPLFTIGQRKGLGLGGGQKIFVQKIDPATHQVTVVEDEEELLADQFCIGSLNLLRPSLLDAPDLSVKVRYRDAGVPATFTHTADELTAQTLEPVKAVTPGQSAVIYAGDEVVGGGIIQSVIQ